MTARARVWTAVAVLASLIVTVGLAGALSTSAQTALEEPQLATDLHAVSQAISYQGQLADAGGSPLNGTHAMQFHLYSQATGGSVLYTSSVMNVAVTEGLFSVGLNAPHSVYDGGPLWLAITVGGETLSPRQQIRPAPYALSLRPGALVRQSATGAAVRVEAPDVALYGQGANYGVYGSNAASLQGYGYGGYFTSTTGIGVAGMSSSALTTTNAYAPGVYGHSEHGVGVMGQTATGSAVYGDSAGGMGLVGVGGSHGVYGYATSSSQGSGYGGYFASNTGIGVAGISTAQLTGNNNLAPGVYGYSLRGAGVMGEAGPSGVAGYFSGTVIITGDLYAGSKGGYVVDLALNAGDTLLSRGDVVTIVGVADPVVGGIPVPMVIQANEARGRAVMGVVDRRYVTRGDGFGDMDDDPAAPGEYLSVVTLGAFRAIAVDASYGAIAPGDLLVASPNPGHAMRGDDPAVGTVVGKALGALDEGTGTVAVLVTLQ